jgi:transcriptional regulator GlxA family with amidase domain
MTKKKAKSARHSTSQIEVGLVCDPGSSPAGIHGLTDLFTYACQFAAKRQDDRGPPPVRITHWRADDGDTDVRCVYDSAPRATHAPTVLLIPGNERATLSPVDDSALVKWLRLKHAEGAVLAAVCGGVFILAKTGLLAGRQATTHWAFRDQFGAQFREVLTETDHMVIDHGDVVTAGGVLAWADLGLRLILRFLGPAVMRDTARFMNMDPPGREQCFYSGFEPRMRHGDQAILKAQLRLAAQRERPIAIAAIARHTCLEPRTFLRRFVQATGLKPSEYQQRLRVSRATELLEFSRRSVGQIAVSVGYEDLGGFRRVFRKITGLTPAEYRRRFGNARSAVRG